MFWIFLNIFINPVAFVIDMTNSSVNPMFKLNSKTDRFNKRTTIVLSFIANVISVFLIAVRNIAPLFPKTIHVGVPNTISLFQCTLHTPPPAKHCGNHGYTLTTLCPALLYVFVCVPRAV